MSSGPSIIAMFGGDISGLKKSAADADRAVGTLASQIAKKFEFKDIGKALVTGLGINLDSIAENVARLYTGISKEEEDAYKQLETLSTQAADANIAAARAGLTEEQKYQLALQEREGILKRMADNQGKTAVEQVKLKQDEIRQAANSVIIEQHKLQVLAQQNKYLDDRLASNEKAHQAALADLSVYERARILRQEVKDIEVYIEQSGNDKAEVERFTNVLVERRNALLLAQNEITKAGKLDLDERHELLLLEVKGVDRMNEAESARYQQLKLITKEKQLQVDIEKLLSIPIAQRTVEEKTHLGYLIDQSKQTENQIALKQQLIDATKTQNAVEQKVAETIKGYVEQWTDFKLSVESVGRGDKDLSDRELARKAENIQQDIQQRQASLNGQVGGVGSGGQGPYDAFLNQDKYNLQQLLAEQNLRDNVRQQAAIFGQDAAFNMNPGLTEQRFAEILGTVTDSSKVVDQLQQLNTNLKNGTLRIGTLALK